MSTDRLPEAVRLFVAAAGAVLVFLFAVQLLGAATDATAPLFRRVLVQVVRGDLPALGIGWLAAYGFGTGSIVAALGLTLFTVDLLTAPQLFLLVVGSRLGAAGIVVFIGAIDYFQRRRLSLVESVSMGMLTFLLTLSVYLPVAGLGYAVLQKSRPQFVTVGGRLSLPGESFDVLDGLTQGVIDLLGAAPSFLLAVILLFGSLKLFDRVLAEVDTGAIRRQLFDRFKRTWVSFGLGLFITGLTTSVAFSLGVIVPLYNRGYVKRKELIPYVLGANIGTLFDTLVVAVVLETAVGTEVVLLVVLLALGLTLLVLGFSGPYSRLVAQVDDRILEDRIAFAGFVALLVLVPAGLLLLPGVV